MEARSAATQARTQAEESYSAVQGEAARARVHSLAGAEEALTEMLRSESIQTLPRMKWTASSRTAHGGSEPCVSARRCRALRRILEEYESSPESVRGIGVAADLVRVIRQIKQLKSRLVQIDIEITSLGD